MYSLHSTTAGATVRWHDFPGSGIPVVFIHGIGCASSYEYPRVVTDPAFGGRRAILIDLPGFGYSDKPLHFDYSTTQQAAVVVELLDSLGITQLDLFGHSMGGSIAIEMAETLGSRVRTLGVSEPNFHRGGGLYSRMMVAVPEQQFVETEYARILAEETSPWKGCFQNAAPHAVWRAAKSMVEGIAPSWVERFLALEGKKAVIFGAHTLPDDDATALAESDIPLHVVADAGHSMAWENPSAFAAVLWEIFGGE